jgi:hypothetical protein
LTIKGFITEDDLTTIPYLRITRTLLDSIDLSPHPDEVAIVDLGVEGIRREQEHNDRPRKMETFLAFRNSGPGHVTKSYTRVMGPTFTKYKAENQ